MKTAGQIKKNIEFFVKNHGNECIFKDRVGLKCFDILTGYDSDSPTGTWWRGKKAAYVSCEEIPEQKSEVEAYRGAVEKAYCLGKKIEWWPKWLLPTDPDSKWRDLNTEGGFNWDFCDYRIKTESWLKDSAIAYREEVEKANKEGKPLQWKMKSKPIDQWCDRSLERHGFPLNWSHYEYRIKPDSKLIEWTAETCPMPLFLRQKHWPTGNCYSVLTVSGLGVTIAGMELDEPKRFVRFSTLADPKLGWEQRNGEPCGVKV